MRAAAIAGLLAVSLLCSEAVLAQQPVLTTPGATTSKGGNVSGTLNFSQKLLVRALYARRAELDADYVNPYTQAAEDPIAPRRSGFIVRLEPGS